MKKINNKSIFLGFKILSILAFGLIFVPFNKAAATPGYVDGYANPISVNEADINNPKPTITSINPRSSNIGTGAKTITVVGSGFVSSSVVKLNDSNRPTTFIDYSHLLVQLTANDMSRADGFYLTVFNRAPGGGYSNASFFTINNVVAPNANTNNSNGSTNTSSSMNQTGNTSTDSNYSALASNAIFGSNSILPSGLIQWIIFAIIILLIVILARKVFGAEKNYHETPMKHA
ncbi:MAG: IPT/TIG domain-containing protein [Candidatus Paceibacterota bacterium]